MSPLITNGPQAVERSTVAKSKKERSRKPGRPINPKSKRQQGVSRNLKPRIAFHLDEELVAALNRYIEKTKPQPTVTSVLILALTRLLEDEGEWPPKEED